MKLKLNLYSEGTITFNVKDITSISIVNDGYSSALSGTQVQNPRVKITSDSFSVEVKESLEVILSGGCELAPPKAPVQDSSK